MTKPINIKGTLNHFFLPLKSRILIGHGYQLTTKSVLFILLLCWQLQSQALDNISIQMEHWATESLHAQNLDISFELNQQGLATVIKAQSLALPEPLNRINNVRLHCTKLQLNSEEIVCQKGSLQFSHTQLGKQQLDLSLKAQTTSEHYQLQLNHLALASGDINLDIVLKQQAWFVNVAGKQIQVSELIPVLENWLDEQQLEIVKQWQLDALVDIDAQLTGQDERLNEVQTNWQLSSLSLSNEEGSIVTDEVTLKAELNLAKTKQNWHWLLTSEWQAGQAYADPLFLDFSEQALALSANGVLDKTAEYMEIEKVLLQHPSLNVEATASIKQGQLVNTVMEVEVVDLAQSYPIWLQPFLYGTAIENLEMSGDAKIQYKGDLQHYTIQLQTGGLSIADEAQRFAIDTLTGLFAWSTTSEVVESQIAWQQAQLYAIDIGAAEVTTRSQNNGVEFTQAVQLPVMDGALKVDQFTLQQTPSASLNWSFSGQLTPISMESLSLALGWPMMHGKLSGVIPSVHYQQHELVVDGALQVNVFDGATEIRDLRLTSPLGALPQLYANIDVENLDLELLTQTFDFGRITGRIDGYVHNLRLSNWQPVNFDAVLATDDENPGKRRISQKAVDNLSQIGGGATGVLAGSFLRFFDDFSYKKLGLSCQLRNEVCEMNGVEPAQQGYYIVKGGGALPPWIDVVGYTHRVDWSDLVARLKAVSESDGPVIE